MPRETESDGHSSEKSAPNPASSGRFGSALDPGFTARVIAATGRNANPRLAEIMPALLRHLHDFAREVELTADEWMAGIQLLNEAGQMSNDARNETQLVCDVLGLESLVDEITSVKQGPRPSSPLQTQPRTSDARGGPKCTPKKTPTAAAPATRHRPPSSYEQQDPAQPEMHLRARLPTDPDGRFALYCLRPPPYPVPDDGPAGRLLGLLDRHPFRPAHIHFIVSCPGRRTLTTQLFDAEDPHLDDDTVFAVKEDLIAVFRPAEETDPMGARWRVGFDFVLAEAA
ncbi:chlorocatechol 1,2-dioxygenase [Verticillium dahliae VdLs.17]|uniref:Chlorocatechol 1,2-dioxygenase n=1 Tax=Verticillium dahliae (strain VdLs.17 / ATCC MYA-4575 / FGSC 10137) TaxID=498257 RepID=G2X7F3_VERDV|nr:chlorocatechol 1,2-dioxygenase [Verticillium dahliae VdLs.17]EGY14921.1 chlorocatechol 1,2-dioxygenase [Verticillium dahliae VdLs.17]